MKHVSLWLTVLLLGALPLTAAAFDYGPNQSLLAANGSNSPQLPGAQVRAAAEGAMPKADAGDVAATNDDDGAFSGHTTAQTHQPSPPAPGPALLPRSHGPSASNKAHQAPASSAAAGAVPSPPSWQSLLPGSIQ
jgi:hypothetical protein